MTLEQAIIIVSFALIWAVVVDCVLGLVLGDKWRRM